MRNVIVTGASRGIGYETVKALVDSGSRVIAVARDGAKLDALSQAVSNSDHIRTLAADITDSSHDHRLKGLVGAYFEGRTDCLINNAGLLIKKPFKALTQQDFDRTYPTYGRRYA